MPDNELEELEDNFWCHNHSHDHDSHSHESVVHENEDKYKSKKSILYNNTTLLVNKNHVNFNNLIISSDQIECCDCNYKIGFKNRKHTDYVYFWRSNILIDDNLKFDFFSLLNLGRYIIEVKNKDKKIFIFIHVLTCNLLYKSLDLKSTIPNDNEKTIKFDKNLKKLLYKIYNQKTDIELRNKWFNDINVEFVALSYDFYLKTLKQLVESSKSLPTSQRKTRNDFFLAVI